jgi:type II secretory pathway pseudopilin PulG
VVVIGLLAAMAIPAFQKVRQASSDRFCMNNLRQLNTACEQSTLENGKPPTALGDLVGPGKFIRTLPVCPAGGEYRLVPGDSPANARIVCSVHGSQEELQQRLRGTSR